MAVGAGLQIWAFVFLNDTKRIVFWSLIIFAVLSGTYAAKQIMGQIFPINLLTAFLYFVLLLRSLP